MDMPGPGGLWAGQLAWRQQQGLNVTVPTFCRLKREILWILTGLLGLSPGATKRNNMEKAVYGDWFFKWLEVASFLQEFCSLSFSDPLVPSFPLLADAHPLAIAPHSPHSQGPAFWGELGSLASRSLRGLSHHCCPFESPSSYSCPALFSHALPLLS